MARASRRAGNGAGTRAPWRVRLAVLALLAAGSGSVQASPDLCRAAARRAAAATAVPVNVLHAISLTETGRRRAGRTEPWPWTINMEGVGKWFDSREAALAYARRHHAAGARSFDLGCFQINYKWHGTAFASMAEMMDPDASALYAARFLRRLYEELGDWSLAAGAYHSRNETYASRYRARFDRYRARLDGTPQGAPAETPTVLAAAAPAPAPAPPPVNSYPLLQRRADTTPRLGSLVPLGAGGGSRLVALE